MTEPRNHEKQFILNDEDSERYSITISNLEEEVEVKEGGVSFVSFLSLKYPFLL